jgi:regulator of protease activity HflC (stomatin/prohibitin superfamily)
MSIKQIIGVVAAFLVVLLLVFCVGSVPTGHTGIITTWGKVEDRTLEAGIYIKSPFQRVIKMDNREQHKSVDTLAFSKDIQETRIKYSVNYQINKLVAMNIYKNIGVNYYEILVAPRLQESIKNTFKQFTASELINKRNELSSSIESMVVEELKQYGINIISIFVEDIDFTDEYTNAVEAKQVAEQVKLRSIIEQEQLTNEANANAEREVIKASAELQKAQKQADAEAYAITKKAEAEAEANIKVAQSLTPELIGYTEVQKWNGQRVIEFNGGGVLPLMDINEYQELK